MQSNAIMLTDKDVLQIVKKLMNFPFPTICRHAVASDLLSMLEERGWKCPRDLAESVIKAEDQKALDILTAMGN